jgi:S-adenosylmethionine synthetase
MSFIRPNYLTAESVSPKHPDKLCDRVSDTILDAALEQDPHSRVAVETVGGHGKVFITGEVTTHAKLDYEALARSILGKGVEITVHIAEQSPEIAHGVDTGGAGDQGIMVGYATNETVNLLPLEVDLSRDLNRFIYAKYPFDGKTQVTVHKGSIESVVASFQNATQADLRTLVEEWLEKNQHDKSVTIHANPAGDWQIGGFEADAGLTGRKLAVDNYGPRIPIGGGCFSGKDASKVDRSAAYMARKVAVDYLKKRDASEVYCFLAYAIGVAEPLQATVVIDGVEEQVTGYDLTPAGIIKFLDLKKPQFAKTAEYGHFGNDFTWDK